MAEVINGTSDNDRLTAISDTSVKAGAGNDTINIAGAQNVTIETGSGKDEIIFPYEGYDNPSVTFTDFDPQNDVLNFPEWAFFYKNYYFRASVANGNLVLKDGLDWYTLTFQGVTSTDEIKDTLVKKYDGYSGKLAGILYNTISGSSSGETNSSIENVIYGTPNDDTLENLYRNNVRIEGLAGNDNIYNFGAKEVTINGGEGNDSIRNSNPIVTINGDAGNDTISNRAYKVFISGGIGNDYISNNKNNVSIYGGVGDDSIFNSSSVQEGGQNYNVLIDGGAGNDFILSTNFFETNTINGGLGNDTINLTYDENFLITYTNGDGNDIIEDLGGTITLSISGGSYNSMTSGDDVIIKVGDGSIILRDANGTALSIIGLYKADTTSPNPEDPTNPNNPATPLPTSSYETNTKTWTIYNGYGDEAIASDYNSEVKNIIATGRNKAIKIIGNELDNLISGGSGSDELFGESGSDTVHGNRGKDTLHGGADNDVLYGDEGNDELHGDAGDDELYGGVGSDILFGTDGKNTLDGGKDSDTLVGGKGEDIFVHMSGDGNDLVLDYSFEQGDKLKFEDELIEDVKVDGTDVIITTENGEKLTIKYAAGKEISYINMRGNTETIDRNGNKPPSADSIYVKAMRLMNSANKTVDSIKSSAADTLYDSAKIKANFAVTELKKNISSPSVSNFKVSDIPDSVYEKISEELFSAFEGSLIDHYEYDSTGSKLVQQIAKQISSGLINTSSVFTAPENKITYTISNAIQAYGGVMSSFIRISWGRNNVAMLTWTNLNRESGQTGLANYLKSLSDLNKDVWKDFVAAWLSPITGQNTRAALDFAEKVVEALCYKDDTKARALVKEIGEDYLDELKSDLNERFTNSAQKLVRKFISKYIPNGNKILDAVDKIKAAASAYDELKEKYTSLVKAIEDYNNLANTGDFLALEKDYNIVENLYNKFDSAITDGINTDDTSDTIIDKFFEALNSVLGISKANAAENVEVTNINSLDDLAANGTSILTFTENLGGSIQNVDLRSSEYPQVVSLESGNQTIQFNDKDGNVAIVSETATGSKNIIFGNGNDLGIFYSPNADIKMTLGSGNDSVLVDNNARVQIDMTNADNATIVPYSGRVTLDNYNPDSRAGVLLPDFDNITNAVKDNSIQLIGDEVRTDSASVKFNNTNSDSTIVNLINKYGSMRKVGFTRTRGGTLDTTDKLGNFLLKGNYAENISDTQKNRGSNIIAGVGNDSILAGSEDVVNGGGGNNQIYLTPQSLRQMKAGAIIVLSNNGHNTVHGFNEGFDYDSDAVKVDDLGKIKFKFEDGLLLRSDDSRLKFNNIGIHTASSDTASNLASDVPEKILITNGSSTIKVAVAQPDQSIAIIDDEGGLPNVFFGDHSGLNFSGYNEDVNIDLSQGTGKLGDEDIKLYGIDKLQGGDRSSTLIGNDGNNTLVAGKGQTSIQSGTGHDKMFGNTDADKNVATFYYMSGDGRDSIENFDFMTNAQDVTADKVQLDDNSAVTDVLLRGDDVMLKVNDADGFLMLEDAQGKSFRLNDDLISLIVSLPSAQKRL